MVTVFFANRSLKTSFKSSNIGTSPSSGHLENSICVKGRRASCWGSVKSLPCLKETSDIALLTPERLAESLSNEHGPISTLQRSRFLRN